MHLQAPMTNLTTLPSYWRAPAYRKSPSVQPKRRQKDVKRPYPANLCPLSCWVEFAGFRENLAEAIGDAIEAVSRRAVW